MSRQPNPSRPTRQPQFEPIGPFEIARSSPTTRRFQSQPWVSPNFLGVSGRLCPGTSRRSPDLECESLLSLWRPELAPSRVTWPRVYGPGPWSKLHEAKREQALALQITNPSTVPQKIGLHPPASSSGFEIPQFQQVPSSLTLPGGLQCLHRCYRASRRSCRSKGLASRWDGLVLDASPVDLAL